MAIAGGTAGTWAEYTTDGTVTVPSSSQGDRLFLLAAWKDQSVTCTVAGWTAISEFADGSVASGNGTGSMRVKAWYLDRGAGAPSNPTLDFSGAVIGGAVIVGFTKAANEVWSTPLWQGAVGFAPGTASFTTSSTAANGPVPDGSVVIAFMGVSDDSATFTRGTTAISESLALITWNGNYVEFPATHLSTTTGNDMAADAGYRLITTNAASPPSSQAQLRASATLSAAETGSCAFVVQAVTVSADMPYLNRTYPQILPQ